MPRVAIVGAGAAGLVSAKQFIEQGFEAVVFEQQADIGGLWNTSTGAMWDSMHTNLSKKTCKFADLDWPGIIDDFPSAAEMFAYLQDYCNKFRLRRYIRFNTKVKSISMNSKNDAWLVNGEQFDYVVIASGYFSKAYIPEIDALKDFKGQILHSSQYKSAEINALAGKRVAVFGSGFSAVEIAADLAEVSKVENIVRTPHWIIPRMISNGVTDKPIDEVFYTQPNRQNWHEEIFKDQAALLRGRAYMASLCPLQTDPQHPLYVNPSIALPNKVAISDNYFKLLQQGKIKIKNELQPNDYDAIIFCTGFNTNLDFLSAECKLALDFDPADQFQPLILHKCTFSSLSNMAFVGMYRGPYFPIMELQAQWVAGVFSGKIAAPTRAEMQASVKQELTIRFTKPRAQFPHGDYVGLKYDLKQALLRKPQPELLWRHAKFIGAGALAVTIALGATYAYNNRNAFRL